MTTGIRRTIGLTIGWTIALTMTGLLMWCASGQAPLQVVNLTWFAALAFTTATLVMSPLHVAIVAMARETGELDTTFGKENAGTVYLSKPRDKIAKWMLITVNTMLLAMTGWFFLASYYLIVRVIAAICASVLRDWYLEYKSRGSGAAGDDCRGKAA